jgi:dihydropyrimidinase
VSILCERPAQILGIDRAKGSLAVGKQADIVVFDPDQENAISEKDIYNRFP